MQLAYGIDSDGGNGLLIKLDNEGVQSQEGGCYECGSNYKLNVYYPSNQQPLILCSHCSAEFERQLQDLRGVVSDTEEE
jgi:hypothetical protein